MASSWLVPPATIYRMFDFDGASGNGFGAMQFVLWEDLAPNPGEYSFARVEALLNALQGQTAIDADGQVIPKPITLSITFSLFDYGQKDYWGYDATPGWVYASAGLGSTVGGRRVGHVLTANNESGVSRTMAVPGYDFAVWREEAYKLIQAFGAKYNGDSRLVATLIAPGMDMETQHVKRWDGIDWFTVCNKQASAVEKYFGDWCVQLPKVYRAAFPNKPVFINNAPNAGLRKPTSDAMAALEPVGGLRNCGAQPAMDSYRGKPGGDAVGSLDTIFEYQGKLPVWLESSHDGDNSFRYWMMLMCLHCKADAVTLHSPIIKGSDPEWLAFLRRYLGKKAATTPSVWCVFRDEEYQASSWGEGKKNGFSDIQGDFQFYLTRIGGSAPRWAGNKFSTLDPRPLQLPTKTGDVRERQVRDVQSALMKMDEAFSPQSEHYRLSLEVYADRTSLTVRWGNTNGVKSEHSEDVGDDSAWAWHTVVVDMTNVRRGSLDGGDLAIERGANAEHLFVHKVLIEPVSGGTPVITPEPVEPPNVEEAIGEAAQKVVLPLNPDAAFEKAGASLGLLPASPEFDVTVGEVQYRAQVYRHPKQRDVQHIVYAVVGQWDKLTWFERANSPASASGKPRGTIGTRTTAPKRGAPKKVSPFVFILGAFGVMAVRALFSRKGKR
jgi:hypothetical protein